MIVLPEPPRLTPPTTTVRTSYLIAEQADVLWRRDAGLSADDGDAPWITDASLDFEAFVAERSGVVDAFGVPSEIFWFCAGEFYLGTIVLRHEFLPDEVGGHLGYAVARPWQRQGHATAMLGQALTLCGERGMERALLTVDPTNVASTRVVEKNGGVRDGINVEGEMRWWCPTPLAAARA